MYNFIFILFLTLGVMSYFKSFNSSRFSSFLVLYVFILLVLVIGPRYASVDYFGYLQVFNRVDFSRFGFPFYGAESGDSQTTGNEFLFATLTSIFKLFDVEPVWWFTTIAALSVGIKLKFYKKHATYLWLTVFLYICFTFGKELAQIRNAFAIGILLFSMQFAIEKKPYKFVATVLMASGVQVFALVMLPLYWLGRAGERKAIFLGLFIIALSSGLLASLGLSITRLFFFIHPAIAAKLSGYLASGGYQLGGLYYFLLLGVLLIFTVGVLKRQREDYYVFSSFCFVGLAGYAIFGEAGALGNRFLDTFLFGTIPLIASLMVNGVSKPYKSLSFLYWLAFGTVIYFAKMSSQAPYQNLLWP